MSDMNIASRAMLVTLTISQWHGKRLDKAATAEVLKAHNAQADAGKFNKSLVSKEALAPTQKAASAARTLFYTNTLPWGDDGSRVLLNTGYYDFMDNMAKAKEAFLDAVHTFVHKEFAVEKSKAQFWLNSLFNPDDYPDIDTLKKCYKFKLSIGPLPLAGDFRVDMNEDEIVRIKEEITEGTNNAVTAAMQHVITSLSDGLKHLHAKLADPKAVFHETTLTNVLDLANRLPNLNLAQDRNFDLFQKEIQNAFSCVSAKELRTQPQIRESAAKSAEEIINKLAGVYKI